MLFVRSFVTRGCCCCCCERLWLLSIAVVAFGRWLDRCCEGLLSIARLLLLICSIARGERLLLEAAAVDRSWREAAAVVVARSLVARVWCSIARGERLLLLREVAVHLIASFLLPSCCAVAVAVVRSIAVLREADDDRCSLDRCGERLLLLLTVSK
jgi:hypothetical protein